jgi:hypothetical protein
VSQSKASIALPIDFQLALARSMPRTTRLTVPPVRTTGPVPNESQDSHNHFFVNRQ